MSEDSKAFSLKSSQFRDERQATWLELERLLQVVDSRGLAGLTAEELHRFPGLYRSTISALSVARSISLDRNLLEYLENLCSRAYVAVYAIKRRPLDTVWAFVSRGFPGTVRRFAPHVLAAAGCMALGVLIGWAVTLADIERYHDFMPAAYAGGRVPSATTEQLREPLYWRGEGQLEQFAAVLFTHNSKVGIFSFSLGFAAGIPVVMLMVYNGLILGAMAALYQTRGMALEFWAWVLPHGVTEFIALWLCGAAGFAFAGAVLFPGERSRLDNLILRGREAGQMVLGAVLLLSMAAVVEGFFRQLVHSQTIRWSVAGVTALLWIVYFGWAGRGSDDG